MISGWLEPISDYPGFRKLWAADKEKMVAGMGTPLADEKFETISGWDAVTYTLPISGGTVQKNLRACRTWGHTWVDVHLSTTSGSADSETLRTLSRAIWIEARQVSVPAR